VRCSCTGTISGHSGGRPHPAPTPSRSGAVPSSEKAKIQPPSSLRVIQMMRPGMDPSPSTTICTQSYRLCKIFPNPPHECIDLPPRSTCIGSYETVGVSRPGGPLGRRVSVAACPSPDGSSAKGGEVRRPEAGVREVGIPRPSCSSRAQVGCACSRGLQASTRVRERAASKRAPVSSSSPRGQPSLRGPWSFLL
jgi:hypothetical protein